MATQERSQEQTLANAGATPLSQFLASVQSILRQHTNEAWVTAEISSLHINQSSGHAYFDLVEHDEEGSERAKCKAAIWSRQRAAIFDSFRQKTDGVSLATGLKVMVLVAVAFHVQHGFSLVIKGINPEFTLGDMQRKLAKIRSNLKASGVWEWNRRRPTPSEFTRVAVVAPAEAAGLGDFKSNADVLELHGLCSFDYFFARFQGKTSSDEIIDAMRSALIRNRDMGGRYYDAVAIIRGGGAISDLAYLNDFSLANAVCRTPIPVMVGIGHERDSVILDEVANYSAHTPSKLIHYITSAIVNNAQAALLHWEGIVAQTERTSKVALECLESAMATVSASAFSHLKIAASETDGRFNFIRATATGLVAKADEQIERLMDTTRAEGFRILDVAKREAEHAFASVIGLGPKQTLQRGFAIVRHEGKVVSRRSMAVPLSEFEIEFSDGKVPVSRTNEAL